MTKILESSKMSIKWKKVTHNPSIKRKAWMKCSFLFTWARLIKLNVNSFKNSDGELSEHYVTCIIIIGTQLGLSGSFNTTLTTQMQIGRYTLLNLHFQPMIVPSYIHCITTAIEFIYNCPVLKIGQLIVSCFVNDCLLKKCWPKWS